jgi:hypothetical protein
MCQKCRGVRTPVRSRREEAVELFATRREAELVVENWNRDEPERAGELRVEPDRDRDLAELTLTRVAKTLVRWPGEL